MISIIAFILLHSSKPIPAAVTSKITFPVYYPKGSPSSFTIAREQISYDETTTVLQMPATSSLSNHAATISEQPLPGKLTFDQIKGEGTVIDGAKGQAAVSNVEGRMVAVMIDAGHKTLILVNSTDASKEELTAIVRSLDLLR
ncbi:MAG TPA: hypothetical protein VLH86_03855 [Patescibacteria group bacterium]|nr:hypothetical protein [Patescibacteria group bacterium]